MFLLLWLLVVGLSDALPREARNITFLNQTNPPIPTQLPRVLCQRITDHYGFPLVYAADDAVFPPLRFLQEAGIAAGVDDCGSLTVAWGGVRSRQDRSPSNITIQFLRHNSSTQTPSRVFYQKTFAFPANNFQWLRDPLGAGWQYELTLRLNEVGDDGAQRFNFRDPYFLQPGETFWVAWYCTAALAQDSHGRSNAMFWRTLEKHPHAVFQTTLLGQPNYAFVVKDGENFLGHGWKNWTPVSTEVEQSLLLGEGSTRQLAWRIWLHCEATTPAPTEAPTHPVVTRLPTAAPTTAPTEEAVNNTLAIIAEKAASSLLINIAIPAVILLGGALVAGVLYIVLQRMRKPTLININEALAEEEKRLGKRLYIPPSQQKPLGWRAVAVDWLDDKIYTDEEEES
jgi:hypothetical protein